MDSPVINLVVVGDAQCGKTSLLSSFFKATASFDDEMPSFDDYVKTTVRVDDRRVAVELRDTVSSEACRRFRLFWYMGSHVILLCFPVDSPESLDRIPDDWMPELRRICPEVPIVLVANKIDLRAESGGNFVNTETGRKMGAKIKATAYLECSAFSGTNVEHVFEVAAKAALESAEKSKKSRCILI